MHYAGEGLEREIAWLLARADEQAVGVAKLFAHIGLKAIDDFAGEPIGSNTSLGRGARAGLDGVNAQLRGAGGGEAQPWHCQKIAKRSGK